MIAATNYYFYAELKDVAPESHFATEKEDVVKFLSDSFDYCSPVIQSYRAQITQPRESPDARMPGREVLLAIYVTHHSSSWTGRNLSWRQGNSAAH